MRQDDLLGKVVGKCTRGIILPKLATMADWGDLAILHANERQLGLVFY